jgi:hypothetical protein
MLPVTPFDDVYMLWIASAKQMWCVKSLITISRGTIFLLAHSFSLLCFSINSGISGEKLTLMPSLYSLEFWYSEFISVKSFVDVPYPLQMPESSCCCIMGSPFNKGRGLRSSWSARSEPQHA